MQIFLTPDELRDFPLPEVAARILHSNAGSKSVNLNTLLRTVEQRMLATVDDRDALLGRLADAWALLEAYALISPSHRAGETGGNWQRVSELGIRLVENQEALGEWAMNAEGRLFGRSLA